jgi:Domain of unknown function (DUF4388)
MPSFMCVGCDWREYNSPPFDMSVSGNLKTMLPGDILQWLSLGQKTGTLFVRSGAVEKRIFFQKGRVISSASNNPREYLGQFLVSHGFLTEQELAKGMEVQQQSGILLGKILVMIEAISENDLLRLMRLKAEEEIYDVFLWTEGDFQFADDELPKMEMVPLQVDVTGIIMEGMRRFDEWQRIREFIQSDMMIPVFDEAVDPDADPELEPIQRAVIRAIDGKRTIVDIEVESRASEFVVSSVVYQLLHDRQAHLVDPTAQKAAAVESEKTAAAQFGADMTEDDEINSLVSRAQGALKAKDFDKAQRFLRAAQNLDPNHIRVRTAVKGAETVIANELRSAGVGDSKVPRMSKAFEDIATMNFSPNEGFLLSRINGTWDIGSLMKISPIRETDALLIFHKLWKEGVITLD